MTLGSDFDTTLTAARAGAEWAWGRIYHDLAPVLLGYLRGRGAHDPEDLVGEVFLRVARSLGSFEGDEAGFRSWVFTIAHHRLVDDRRKRSRWQLIRVDDEETTAELPAAPDVEPEALERLGAAEISHLLATVLTEDQHDVLLLRLVGGLTIPEIAEVVGRSENATKALQRRGLRSLQRYLEENPGQPYPFEPPGRSQE